MSDDIRQDPAATSWAAFCEALKQAGDIILRPESPAAEIDRAEGWRYLSRLTRIGLEMMVEFADPDFPVFYAASHETVKIGGDNPDNVYRNAAISGAREYRLRGRRGSAPYLTFGTKANRLAGGGGMASTGELDAKDMVFAPDGSFEIRLSRTPQQGNWLPMAADSTMLLVRETFLDRTAETASTLLIECLDGPARPAPLGAERIEHALAASAAFVKGTAATFAGWAELFRRHPNRLPIVDQAMFQQVGGHPSIFYVHGYWQLAPDEALVVDTEIPDCAYWNFVLQNYWMESNDYRYLPTYVNKRSARPNPDGSVTITIAAADPGARNYIDTAGHGSGTMLLRWVDAGSHPEPRCRVVKLAQLCGES